MHGPMNIKKSNTQSLLYEQNTEFLSSVKHLAY
jgi:hypothetical protein